VIIDENVRRRRKVTIQGPNNGPDLGKARAQPRRKRAGAQDDAFRRNGRVKSFRCDFADLQAGDALAMAHLDVGKAKPFEALDRVYYVRFDASAVGGGLGHCAIDERLNGYRPRF